MAAQRERVEARRGRDDQLFVDVTPDPKVHVYAPGAKGTTFRLR